MSSAQGSFKPFQIDEFDNFDDSNILKAGGGMVIAEPVRGSGVDNLTDGGLVTSEPIRSFDSSVHVASESGGQFTSDPNLFFDTPLNAGSGGVTTAEPVLPFMSSGGIGGGLIAAGSGGLMVPGPVQPFDSTLSDGDGGVVISEPMRSPDFAVAADDVYVDLLMSGSDLLTVTEPVRPFDASLITDAGNSFNVWRGDSAAAVAAADTTGGNIANAATLASIQTIGTYIAMSSPSSAGGRHFAAGSTVSVNLTGLLLAGELLYARTALAAWARVANIHFVETTGAAQITMTDDNDAINYNAYTSTSWSNLTTISSASIHISQKWYNANGGAGGPTGVLNGYGYQTYVHELGHALGLGHDGPYNGSATYGVSNIFTNDSWQFSTMSYFDQLQYGGASYAYITSAMQADIYGIQLLYGVPAYSGSHKFGYGSTVGAEYDLAQSNSFAIYSADGLADLDASQYAGAQTVNFNAGTFSSIKGLKNNVSLALNTSLISYEGGSGVDTVVGNSLDSRMDGGAGADNLYGFGGDDILIGGAGADFMYGGAGNDTYYVDNISDFIDEGAIFPTLGGGGGSILCIPLRLGITSHRIASRNSILILVWLDR